LFHIFVNPPKYSKNPDKVNLREQIQDYRRMGWSYREIAAAVGVHFTRVGQILRNK